MEEESLVLNYTWQRLLFVPAASCPYVAVRYLVSNEQFAAAGGDKQTFLALRIYCAAAAVLPAVLLSVSFFTNATVFLTCAAACLGLQGALRRPLRAREGLPPAPRLPGSPP